MHVLERMSNTWKSSHLRIQAGGRDRSRALFHTPKLSVREYRVRLYVTGIFVGDGSNGRLRATASERSHPHLKSWGHEKVLESLNRLIAEEALKRWTQLLQTLRDLGGQVASSDLQDFEHLEGGEIDGRWVPHHLAGRDQLQGAKQRWRRISEADIKAR